MQPLHKAQARLSKLLRTYVADQLNAGMPENIAMELEIAPDAENVVLSCDARLLQRAISNLEQHPP